MKLTPELLQEAKANLVVTGSALRSTELLNAFEQQQRSSGVRAWSSINLTNYQRWIIDLYSELQERGNPKAQRIVISDDALRLALTQCAPDEEVLKHVAVVQEAWQLAWQWDLWPKWEDVTSTENGRLCKRWLEVLRNSLRSNELISRVELDHVVVAAIESGELNIPPVTFFQLFDPYRMQSRLFSALKNVGTCVQFEDQIEPHESHGKLAAFSSREEELNAIGTWAREKLAEHGDSARIGVVASDWPVHVIRRQFESSFPEIHDIGQLISTSERRSLGDTIIWRELDTFLRWTKGPLHYSEVLPLRNSTFLSALNVPSSFKRNYGEYISLAQFGGRTKNDQIQGILNLLQINRSARRSPTASFAKHVENLIEVLRKAGWENASSESFTRVVQKAIATALDTVAGNSGLLENATWRDFVDFFRQIGANIHLEENDDKAPIQILTVAASRGLQFDALWVSGMSDAQWPGAITPNAMIPLKMQKEAFIHRTGPHDELRFAQDSMSSWYSATEELVFSYSNEVEDTKAEHSKLINLTESSREDLIETFGTVALRNHPWELSTFDGEMETYANHQASKLDLKGRHKAPTRLLYNQANCPFKAWAENRLQLLADQPDLPETFPDATGRGNYFHDLMSDLSKGREKKRDFLDLRKRIDHIEGVIDRILAKASPRLPTLFATREKEILLRMVQAWIDHLDDEQTPEFTVVGTEMDAYLTIGEFVFKARLDKVQLNQNNELEVIDYKTGSVSAAEWNPERLDPSSGYKVDTQMALYSQIQFELEKGTNDSVASMGYEVVSTTDAKAHDSIHGIRITSTMLRDVPFFRNEFGEDFSAFRDRWNSELVELTKDFVQGKAHATPRSRVCDYCELNNLCRQYDIK